MTGERSLATPMPVGRPSRVPESVGRYRLCFQLARGGMATVYLARADGPGGFSKLVALKCIHPHLADEPAFVSMFFDEARLLSRIDHPNVCSVFDFGEAEGLHYIAMEFLAGETLAAVARHARRNAADVSEQYPLLAAHVVAEAARGLHAAHEARDDDGTALEVVHRDISPQNIIATYDGAVRLLDFGVARALGRSTHTRTGVLKGKLGYIAPEQLRGDPGSRRSDVWSLGVVLWEAVTAQRLFRRSTEADTLLAVLHGPTPAPSRVRAGVPPAFDAIVSRALDRDPSGRPPSASAFADAIDDAVLACGAAIPRSVLAEWMSTQFAIEHARAEQLAQLARQLTRSAVPRAEKRKHDDDTVHEQARCVVEAPVLDSLRSATPRLRPTGRWVAGGIGLAALLLAASIAALLERSTSVVTLPVAVNESGPGRADPAVTPHATSGPPQRLTVEPVANSPPDSSGAREVDPGDTRSARTRPSAGPAVLVPVVTTGGWAQVYERGRALGTVPGSIPLAPGVHVLEFRNPEGRALFRQRVHVRAGASRTIVAHLEHDSDEEDDSSPPSRVGTASQSEVGGR